MPTFANAPAEKGSECSHRTTSEFDAIESGEIVMGKNDRTSMPPKTAREKAQDKSKTPMAPAAETDDFEDGDMATPKLDRYGNDDEPL